MGKSNTVQTQTGTQQERIHAMNRQGTKGTKIMYRKELNRDGDGQVTRLKH